MLFDTNGGSFVPSQTVNHGDKITRPVDPTKTGYIFAGWYKDSGLTIPWDFSKDVVTSNITLYAKWSSNSYSITLRANPSGAGSPSASPNPAMYGQTVTLSANPGACYNFSSWSSSDATLASTTASVTTFTMPAKNVTVTANYAIKTTYKINASAGTGGSISPSGQTTVNCGGTITYTITPSTWVSYGYVIGSVIVDGINVGAVSSYTFSNVTSNHTIVANFNKLYPVVINIVSPSGKYLNDWIYWVDGVTHTTYKYWFCWEPDRCGWTWSEIYLATGQHTACTNYNGKQFCNTFDVSGTTHVYIYLQD